MCDGEHFDQKFIYGNDLHLLCRSLCRDRWKLRRRVADNSVVSFFSDRPRSTPTACRFQSVYGSRSLTIVAECRARGIGEIGGKADGKFLTSDGMRYEIQLVTDTVDDRVGVKKTVFK